MATAPDITSFKNWSEFLAFLGVNVDAIVAQLEAFKASHPDASGLATFAESVLANHLGSTVLTALGQAAAQDLVNLITTGSGPIGETSPTDFA